MDLPVFNIVIAALTKAASVFINKRSDRRETLDKYERAVTEGYVYDSGVNTLSDMCRRFILTSIARHTDGQSYEYGFHKVVRKYNISNPKEFLNYVIDHQAESDDPFTFDQVKYLLKLK